MQAAYCALGQFQAASDDADKAITLDPDWAKTYSRKGKALYGMRSFKKAADAYARGLELCLKGALGEANQRDAELEYDADRLVVLLGLLCWTTDRSLHATSCSITAVLAIH